MRTEEIESFFFFFFTLIQFEYYQHFQVDYVVVSHQLRKFSHGGKSFLTLSL